MGQQISGGAQLLEVQLREPDGILPETQALQQPPEALDPEGDLVDPSRFEALPQGFVDRSVALEDLFARLESPEVTQALKEGGSFRFIEIEERVIRVQDETAVVFDGDAPTSLSDLCTAGVKILPPGSRSA